MGYLESRDLVHRLVMSLTCTNYEVSGFHVRGFSQTVILLVIKQQNCLCSFVDCMFLLFAQLHFCFIVFSYCAEIWLQEMSWYLKIILPRYFELIDYILYCILI